MSHDRRRLNTPTQSCERAARTVFRPTLPNEQAKVLAFIKRVFATESTPASVEPKYVYWKYFQVRECWSGSRSYVLDRQNSIRAHGAVHPGTLLWNGKCYRTIHIIDWAADPNVPGAGVSLLDRMTRMVDITYAIGGSAATKALVPEFGFKPMNELWVCARPLRPFRQILTHQVRNIKLIPRFIRNTAWSLIPALRPDENWVALPAKPEDIAPELWPTDSSGLGVIQRGSSFFQYFLTCDNVAFELYQIYKHGLAVGYFCLVWVPGQVRIADLWMPSMAQEDLVAAYRLATLTAFERGDASEIVAASSTPVGQQSLLRSGFRVRSREPIMVYPRERFGGRPVTLHLQMIDNDAAHMHGEAPCYLT